ncbi:hypothetical protein POSPLDRAFT_102718 [Postia placenta Mad-698-R]|nr:hypothetical protein POSPLDRAFT_102718 [Postia placenta Mad-698-R]
MRPASWEYDDAARIGVMPWAPVNPVDAFNEPRFYLLSSKALATCPVEQCKQSALPMRLRMIPALDAAHAISVAVLVTAATCCHFTAGLRLVTHHERRHELVIDKVQNSYSYEQSDWENDITTAAGIGIDGFAYDYEVGQLVTAFSVAEQLGFKLFFSFDMSYSWSSDDMVALVQNYSTSSASYKWNGDILVSTYSGETYGESFWADFKSTLAGEGITISLAPAFTSYRDPDDADSLMSNFTSIDGFFNWWSCLQLVNGVGLPTWTPISPQQLILPTKRSLKATARDLTLWDDQVVFWYRVWPKDTVCCCSLEPRNYEFPEDAIFAIALLSEPATIQMNIGSSASSRDAPAGHSIGSVPFPTEDAQIPYIQIIRDGTTIKDGYGSYYINQTGCTFYNFNPFVDIIS